MPVDDCPQNPAAMALADAGRPLLDWLCREALPTWRDVGIDRDAGGFFEAVTLDGRPIEAPRRTRVVARQIYVFATAARRGWMPGADTWVEHGLRFLFGRLRLPDGSYASSVRPDGSVVNGVFDLYEHAFVLFALAAARRGRPDREALRLEAERLLAHLRRGWAHPMAGFEEARPRALPLRSNPHMHLLEAALEWCDVSDGEQRVVWKALANELAGLCLSRFIAPANGALSELFDGDWRPMADGGGRVVVEPGHQFEWAWLLQRWARLGDRPQALTPAQRLLSIGEQHGVDARRGVAVNSLDGDLQVSDAAAKLWPQTERLKAWHDSAHRAAAAGTAQPLETAQRHVTLAVSGLQRYLRPAAATCAGLWEEVLNADDRFAPQDCKASSLYHIVCAIDTLQGTAS